ncbi:galactokinase [Infirmifilum uzonense]|uniref:galactokinase n=1 Tax=Infirmifilum uzonense TaxID=1550241 RepID=UPI00069B0877|nr:galactokinase family protein [Infirmifilum uzonense]
MKIPYELSSSLDRTPLLVASAPGRIDFLNTHQDYKGLPVVPVAVNLRTYVAVLSESYNFQVISLNLKKEGAEFQDVFSATNPELHVRGWWGNYLRAVVIALEKYRGLKLTRGFKAVIYSEVPIGSGLSSSAALEVAFLKALDAHYNLGLSPEEVAELAFLAENRVAGIPCGRLDQYASSLGGAILLYPKPPVRVEKLEIGKLNLIIADSGIRHSVADIHPKRQAELNEALRTLYSMDDIPPDVKAKIKPSLDETLWDQLSFDELEGYLSRLPEKLAKRVTFTLLMHQSTMRVVESLKTGRVDLNLIAYEVNYQHELLRDLYDVSLPELEKIRSAMLAAGALGVKISGAGLGGSLLGLTQPDSNVQHKILEEAMRAGAQMGWSVRVDRGASIDFQLS